MGRSVPNLATVENLAKALCISPGWLAYGEGLIAAQSRGRANRAEQIQESVP